MDFFRPYGTFFVLGGCPAMNRWAIFARPSGTANREFVLPGTWNRLAKEGEPADIILQTASSLAANLIVMTTDGPEGFLDGLRGTTSERVLRKAHCPIANLPVGSMLG